MCSTIKLFQIRLSSFCMGRKVIFLDIYSNFSVFISFCKSEEVAEVRSEESCWHLVPLTPSSLVRPDFTLTETKRNWFLARCFLRASNCIRQGYASTILALPWLRPLGRDFHPIQIKAVSKDSWTSWTIPLKTNWNLNFNSDYKIESFTAEYRKKEIKIIHFSFLIYNKHHKSSKLN